MPCYEVYLTRGGSSLSELVSSIYTTVGLSTKEVDTVCCLSRLRLIRMEAAKSMVVGIPGRVMSAKHVSDLVSAQV